MWLVGALSDRLWFTLDRSVPAWDPADYLNGAMNYWQALQAPQWLSGEWWRHFWLLSTKIPPLTYIVTAPFLNLFGTSQDAATLVLLLFQGILLISVYGLGVVLFSSEIGLWAAGICQLLPALSHYRLIYLLDYPVAAVVALSFWLLTLWYFKGGWFRGIAFGLSLGVALMVKQTVLLFLFLPWLWVFLVNLRQRKGKLLLQLLVGCFLSLFIWGPWYRTNWLLIFTAGKRATIDSAIIEGDPALHTLDAWTYYGKILPTLISWPLLLVPIVALLLYYRHSPTYPKKSWTWLAVFLLGGYFLSSLNLNKDPRYILPLLPVLSPLLAVGLLSWGGPWRQSIRWGTLGLAFLLMVLNLFPLRGEILTNVLSPHGRRYPYLDLGAKLPHQEVIAEIIATSPYLRTTLGVLPSTGAINQHNFSFYGSLANFQVYGRQVGVRDHEVEQDGRSLDWFLTKTGDQGSVPSSQTAMVEAIQQGEDFSLHKSWPLPDESTLQLYHRRQPAVEVEPIADNPILVQLNKVTVPEKVSPGVPVPVTYQWSGSWSQLASGLVILTWQQGNGTSFWLHDHGIGMGRLKQLPEDGNNGSFQVTERTAMLPGFDVAAGNYQLAATYLNWETGEIYPIIAPSVTLTIEPNAPIVPAPELDLVTQLRTVAPGLAKGREGLEPIFAQIARINQYDAIQDYLQQAELTLAYRLEQEQDRDEQEKLNWVYTMALARVLQQDIEGAIAAFEQGIELDKNNPYNYAYLAFVYLYDWQGKQAEQVLKPALEINPDLPVLQALSGIAAVMQGKLIQAWYYLSQVDFSNI